MHEFAIDPVITEDEVSEIERISEENARQIAMNRRIALTILAYDRDRLYKSVARDPETYHQLIGSLKDCMEALKNQIRILETAETRLRVPLGEHAGPEGKVH